MHHDDSKNFAAIHLDTHIVLGTILSMDEKGLVLKFVSDAKIPVGSLQTLDIFTKGRYRYKNLPVKILSDQKTISKQSFSKLVTRTITVGFNAADFRTA